MSRSWIPIAAAGALIFMGAVLLPSPQELRVAPLDRYGTAIASGSVPYRDFSIEYPPGALPPIALPAFVPRVSYTAAFRALEAMLGCLVVICVAFLLRDASLRERLTRVGLVAAMPLLLGPVVFVRYDLWPTVLVLLSLVTLVQARARVAGGFLGAAIAAKLYPAVLLAPLILSAEHQQAGHGKRALKAGIVAFAVFMLPFGVLAPGGLAWSLLQQGGRGLQLESVPASVIAVLSLYGAGPYTTSFEHGAYDLHGPGVAAVVAVTSMLGIGAIALMWRWLWRHRDHPPAPVVVYAASVAIVVVFAKVLSPQYLIWLVPLVALVRGQRGAFAAAALAFAMLFSRVLYPSHYEGLVALQSGPVLLLAARNLLVVAAGVLLIRQAVQRQQQPAAGAAAGVATV
jgi:uncharacterized membrane protein